MPKLLDATCNTYVLFFFLFLKILLTVRFNLIITKFNDKYNLKIKITKIQKKITMWHCVRGSCARIRSANLLDLWLKFWTNQQDKKSWYKSLLTFTHIYMVRIRNRRIKCNQSIITIIHTPHINPISHLNIPYAPKL